MTKSKSEESYMVKPVLELPVEIFASKNSKGEMRIRLVKKSDSEVISGTFTKKGVELVVKEGNKNGNNKK